MEKNSFWERAKRFIKKVIGFILNPHFLLCFGIGWMITNGWSYIMLVIGLYFNIAWMTAVAGAYLTFLWLPISPEKIVTVSIAIVLLKFLFPKDEKTLGVLREMYGSIKQKIKGERAENGEKEKENTDNE
ncbi:MAG: hypothetical protein IJY24_06135 [Clostridia bacterium]|nr:hypothetical protein [Clostridia bacterium]